MHSTSSTPLKGKMAAARGTFAAPRGGQGLGDLEGAAPKAKAKTKIARSTLATPDDYRKNNSSAWTPETDMHTLDVPSFVVNLITDIVPPGFLPFAAATVHVGWTWTIVIYAVIMAGCAYTMWCIGRVIEVTGKITFRDQWAMLIGEGTAWLPLFILVVTTLGCCLCLSCFASELFGSALPVDANTTLIAFSIFPLLPLVMVKSLAAMSYTSYIAVLVLIYVTAFMGLRFYDGSYNPGGIYHEEALHDKHKFNTIKPNGHDLVLISVVAHGFLTHYNGCKFYRELAHTTPARYLKCTIMGFIGGLLCYGTTMIFGMYTFGEKCESVILNNYSDKDMLANIARVGTGFSLLFAFPIMFSGLREAGLDLLVEWKLIESETAAMRTNQNIFSALALLVITIGAFFVGDPHAIVGLTGSICGAACSFILPCILYRQAMAQYFVKEKNLTEIFLLAAMAVLGAIVAVTGTLATLTMHEHHDEAHDAHVHHAHFVHDVY